MRKKGSPFRAEERAKKKKSRMKEREMCKRMYNYLL